MYSNRWIWNITLCSKKWHYKNISYGPVCNWSFDFNWEASVSIHIFRAKLFWEYWRALYLLIAQHLVMLRKYFDHRLQRFQNISKTDFGFYKCSILSTYNEVMTWKRFPHDWNFVRGIHGHLRLTGGFSSPGSTNAKIWCFFLFLVWTNSRDDGDLVLMWRHCN